MCKISEDNHAFQVLFDKQKEEENKRYGWMNKQANEHNSRLLAIQAANNEAVKSISVFSSLMLFIV